MCLPIRFFPTLYAHHRISSLSLLLTIYWLGYLSPAVFVAHTLASAEEVKRTPVEGAKKETAVKLLDFESDYIVSDRIPIRYTVTKTTTGSPTGGIELNHHGFQYAMGVELVNEDGKKIPLPPIRTDTGGQGMGVSPKLLYKLQPNEVVELGFDLAELFDLSQPGKYRLKIKHRGREVADRNVRIFGLTETARLDVQGWCVYPPYFVRPQDLSGEVKCKVETGSVAAEKSMRLTAITVKDITLVGEEAKRPILRYKTSRDATVKQAILDYRWQLWVTLESSGQMSLVLFDLRSDQVQVAIPWSRSPIELGTTIANRLYPTKAKVVIASSPGRTSMSSMSVSMDRDQD